MTSGTINDSTKTYSWTLHLFWVLVPLTIACGIWDLGVWSVFAHVVSILIGGVYCIITGFRLMDRLDRFDRAILAYTWKQASYSYAQGFAWGSAMIFAWPGAWVGPIYLMLLLINFCLLESRRAKKS